MSRPVGFQHTEQTKRRMCQAHKGFSGHKHTEASKRRIREKAQGHRPMLGRKHSPATKERMSITHKGSRNANWNGGITLGVRLFRKSRQYQQWRTVVLARDDHVCRVCGGMEKLNAHHILPVKDYPELRLIVLNGLAICKSCHREKHSATHKN